MPRPAEPLLMILKEPAVRLLEAALGGPISREDGARVRGSGTTTVDEYLRPLATFGFLEQQRDGRRVLYVLTDAGRSIVARRPVEAGLPAHGWIAVVEATGDSEFVSHDVEEAVRAAAPASWRRCAVDVKFVVWFPGVPEAPDMVETLKAELQRSGARARAGLLLS